MNDILEGSWKQIHGQLREWWGDLQEDDLIAIEGMREHLAGDLQKRSAGAQDHVEKQLQRPPSS